MADETSNAVIESDITQTVSDGINSLDPKEGVMEYLFIYLSIYLSMNSILPSCIRMSIYSLSI